MVDITVILPTYNERYNILNAIEKIDGILSGIGKQSEILIVDDDSPDNTKSVVYTEQKKSQLLKAVVYL